MFYLNFIKFILIFVPYFAFHTNFFYQKLNRLSTIHLVVIDFRKTFKHFRIEFEVNF